MFKLDLTTVGGVSSGILKEYEAVFLDLSDKETGVIDPINCKMYFTNMSYEETMELIDDIKKSIAPLNFCKNIFEWFSENDLVISTNEYNIEKIYKEAVEKNLVIDYIRGYDDEVLSEMDIKMTA